MRYEEFKQKVVERVLEHDLSAFPKEDVIAFCEKEEEYIKEGYEDRKAAINRGEVKGFEAGISGVAFGLGMMF